MNKNNISFRLEREEDYGKVENMVRESFWNVYRPGCLDHYVLKKTAGLSSVREKTGFRYGA